MIWWQTKWKFHEKSTSFSRAFSICFFLLINNSESILQRTAPRTFHQTPNTYPPVSIYIKTTLYPSLRLHFKSASMRFESSRKVRSAQEIKSGVPRRKLPSFVFIAGAGFILKWGRSLRGVIIQIRWRLLGKRHVIRNYTRIVPRVLRLAGGRDPGWTEKCRGEARQKISLPLLRRKGRGSLFEFNLARTPGVKKSFGSDPRLVEITHILPRVMLTK